MDFVLVPDWSISRGPGAGFGFRDGIGLASVAMDGALGGHVGDSVLVNAALGGNSAGDAAGAGLGPVGVWDNHAA